MQDRGHLEIDASIKIEIMGSILGIFARRNIGLFIFILYHSDCSISSKSFFFLFAFNN